MFLPVVAQLMVQHVLNVSPFVVRITKLRENCEKEWEAHYKCLEKHNQEYYACRKPERTFNECVFSKLVRVLSYPLL